MRKLTALLLCLFAFLPQGASAAVFNSPEYGFAANFPAPPQAMPPQPSEKDSSGATLSMATLFNAAQQGVYFSTVTVDVFNRPYTIDVPASLLKERDNFVAAFKAPLTEQHTGLFQGSPATFFAFAAADHSIQGRGMVIILDRPTPRIYIVAIVYTAAASQDQITGLNRFVDSFRLQ